MLVDRYPVVVYEARRNLGFLCCSKYLDGSGKLGCKANFFLNLGIVGGTAAVGIVIPMITAAALNFIIEFVGSTCSPIMVFLLPAVFFLKATEKSKTEKHCFDRAVAYVLLVFGCILIPVCVTLWLLGIICSAQPAGHASGFCYELGLLTNTSTATATNMTNFLN